MKKTALAALLVCAAILLGGCGRGQKTTTFPPSESSTVSQHPSQEAAQLEEEGELYGSAKQLAGRIAVVAVFWEDAQDSWGRNELQTAQQQLVTALDFLEEQAAGYGVEAEFCYSPAEGVLNYRQSSPDETLNLTDHLTDFYQQVVSWMDTALPEQQLLEQYQAESVCYLVFLPKSGTSFTLPRMADVPEQLTQRELSFVFYYQDAQRIQRQCPYIYAHELLHQFGAIDLYSNSPQLPAGSRLPEYVAAEYPDEIMGGNTQGHYYETELTEIGFEITPLTAYCLGWADTLPELDSYPELTRIRPGALYSSEYYQELIQYELPT